MSGARIPFSERPSVRLAARSTHSPAPAHDADARAFKGIAFANGGGPHTGGRSHGNRPSDNLGVSGEPSGSSTPKPTPIFVAKAPGRDLALSPQLPATWSPGRRTSTPRANSPTYTCSTRVMSIHGKKHYEAQSSMEAVLVSAAPADSSSPRAASNSPARLHVRAAENRPRDNLLTGFDPVPIDSPRRPGLSEDRGLRVLGAAPAFVPAPMGARTYTPQRRQIPAHSQSTLNLEWVERPRPPHRATSPSASSRRYDIISGQPI